MFYVCIIYNANFISCQPDKNANVSDWSTSLIINSIFADITNMFWKHNNASSPHFEAVLQKEVKSYTTNHYIHLFVII